MQVFIFIMVLLLIIGVVARLSEVSTYKAVKTLNDMVIPKIDAMVLLVTEEEAETIIHDGTYIPDAEKTIRKHFGNELKREWLDEWLKGPTIISIKPRYVVGSTKFAALHVRDELKDNGISAQISESSKLYSTIHYTVIDKDDFTDSYVSARLVIVAQLVTTGPFRLMDE